MNFQSPLDNQAARSALVSTGIVGLTATIVQKVWGKGPKISLPVGVGTALVLDYAHKRYRNHKAVRTMNGHAWNYMRNQVEHAKAWVDRSWYEEQMTMAWVALGGVSLAGAYAFSRNMRGVRDIIARNIPTTVVVDLLENHLPYVRRGVPPPRNVGPPREFDPIKAQSYLRNNLITVGVIFASLNMLAPDQVQQFATWISSLFIDHAIQPLMELFTEGPEDPILIHERIMEICENASGAVLDDLCAAEAAQDLDGLPEVPSIVGIVEDGNGNRVAMTLDRDQAQEVPLVHIDGGMEEQLRSQYSANVEPGDQVSLGASSELTQPEEDLVQLARQQVLSAPIQGVAGGKSLRDLIRETVDDQLYQPPAPEELPQQLNSEGVTRPPGDRSGLRDQLLSNGKTLRQMVFESVMDDSSAHDSLSEMSGPLEPQAPSPDVENTWD
jgi:hypothetical protein